MLCAFVHLLTMFADRDRANESQVQMGEQGLKGIARKRPHARQKEGNSLVFQISKLLPQFFIGTRSARIFRYLCLAGLALVLSMGGIFLTVHKLHRDTALQNPLQCQGAARSANPTAAENLCPGTMTWRPDHPLGSEDAIEGFSAPISVNSGETVKFYVSTTAPSYTLQIFRLGWYQGLGGRLMYSSTTLTGIKQPPPLIDPATRMVSCSNWYSQASVNIPPNWVSGAYIVKLLSSTGYIRYIIFIVRNDASVAPIIFQTSVLTYEAYNLWGGYDLYRGLNSQGQYVPERRSYVVSFDRPFTREVGTDFTSSYNGPLLNNNDVLNSLGLGDFPLYSEYPMVRWMERAGYNITYSTDIDTDLRGPLLLKHRLYISAGHDEYWSTAMRDSVISARDQGVSLGFFGGNDVYWHVRLQNSPLGPDREVVCYKAGYYHDPITDPFSAINPRESTVRWQDKPLSEPANGLLGEMYGGGVRITAPLVLASGAAPFMGRTGLHIGSTLPGLVGGEYDRVYHTSITPSSLLVLSASPLKCIPSTLCPENGTDIANATLYTAPSGARVFDAGTFLWGKGLDDDGFTHDSHNGYSVPAFQKFTANILTYLLRS